MSDQVLLPDSVTLTQSFKRLWLLDAADVPPGMWSRRDNEDALWYDRFLLYVSLGPSRTLTQARHKAKGIGNQAPKHDVDAWRQQLQLYDWDARAGAYDEFVNEMTLRASLEARLLLRYFAPEAALTLVQLLKTEDALQAAKTILDRAAVPTETKIDLKATSDDELKRRINERLTRLGLDAPGAGDAPSEPTQALDAVGQA